ncbi:ArnT family glycosyltransferase [Cyclobacterium plantarum]|uniref:ArnT family glycosyltransferase n=1 Tax=Cyclobacterium plantarum TaxID=2716263 RepID=UPI003F6F0D34
MKGVSFWSCCLILLSAVVFIAGLDSYSIYILDESKNAEAAREMWNSGNWFNPTFNGQPRYDKPPLHYFFMGAAYSVLGVGEFSSRLFSGIFGWLTGILIFLKVKNRIDERAAQVSLFSFIISVQVLIQFRMSVPDPYLIFFLTAACLELERYLSNLNHPVKHLRKAAILLALAFLAKGPVAVALVVPPLLAYLLIQRHSHHLKLSSFHDPLAIILFFGIGFSWYVGVFFSNGGDWLKEFFINHNLNRYSSPMEGHRGPFYLPLIFCLIGFFPSSLILVSSWKLTYQNIRRQPLTLWSILYIVFVILFFSFANTKLPHYIAPAFPFLSILIGCQYYARPSNMFFNTVTFLGALVLIALPFALFFTQDLQKSSFGETFSLVWGILPALLGLVAVYFVINKAKVAAYFFLGFGFLGFAFFLIGNLLPAIDVQNPVTRSKIHWENESRLYYWKKMNPAFPFQSRRIIPAWDESTRAEGVIITDRKVLDSFPYPYEEIFQGKDIFEGTEVVLIRPKPSDF